MSLQVWLPLTKDLRQQGIDRSIISGNNVTISSGGKLGNCYSFNGNNSYLLSNSSPFSNSTDNWSYACWFKPNNQHQGCLFSCRTGTNSTGMTIFYYNTQILFDDGTRWQFTPSTAITTGAWNHLVFVRKKGVGKYCYLNGQLIGSTSTTGTQTTVGANYAIGNSQSANTTLTGNPLNGYLNDVRIYNHALSQAEVKELAKGLVLHYSLTNGGAGNPNILTDFDTSFQSYTNGSTTLFNNQMNGGTQEIVSNIGGINKCLHLHSLGGNSRQYRTKSVSQGKTYTISADYYSTNAQSTAWRGELNGGNYSWQGAGMAYTTPGKWQRLYYTYSNLTSDATIYFFIYCANGQDCYVKNIKIEEGSSATPWCSASSIPATTEYDCSGFCNNGTKTGTFTYTSDTSKYQVSTNFNDTTTITSLSTYDRTLILPEYTIAVWVKTSSIPSAGSYFYKGLIDLYFTTSGTLTYMYGSSSSGGSGSSVVYTLGEWIHIVVTRDNTGLFTVYINGVNKYTTTRDMYARYTTDVLGYNKSFTGQLSDFRIYATALSADEAISLYQNNAYIDDSGNIHGQIH